MALSRTLEMLKAGERINDLLYRSTVNGSRQPLARRLAAVAATPLGGGASQSVMPAPHAGTPHLTRPTGELGPELLKIRRSTVK